MIRNVNRWLFLVLTAILLCGMILIVYTAQRADTLQREKLLTETRLVQSGIPAGNLERLTGSESDLGSPDYRIIKEALIRQRNADSTIRFAYALGRRPEGTVFFFADSEIPESPDYSPPGEIYPEATTTLRTAFSSGYEITEGPVSDRWGTWISGIVPVRDPATGSIIAVIGTDMDARDWNTQIIIACGPAIIATFLLILLVLIFFYVLDRNEREMREREATAAVIRESEERFRMLFEENPNPIFIFEVPSGTITCVNKKFVSFIGIPEQAILGKPYSDFGILQDPADRQRLTTLILNDQLVNDLEFRIIHKDGTKGFFLLSARPVTLNNASHCFTIMQDVSELKAVEEEMHYYSSELQKYTMMLAQTNDKLNLLNTITRHDIVNQLTAMNGFLDLIRTKNLDPDLHDKLSKVIAAADNIQEQISFTQDYQDVGAQSPRWFNFPAIISSIIVQLHLSSVTVVMKCDNIELYADPLLGKVFYTLLENAGRHGGTVTRIEFSCALRDNVLVVSCQDNGIGIPAEFKEAIFNRTYYHNTGFGLYLSRTILGTTGIEIRETGIAGEGARFEIIVPKGNYRLADKKQGISSG